MIAGGSRVRPGAISLTRASTVGIVVSTTLALGGLGMVAGAALARPESEPSPRHDEAGFLPVVASRIGVRGEATASAPPYDQVSLGGAGPGGPSDIDLTHGAVALAIPDEWTVVGGDGREWSLLTLDGTLWVWIQSAATDPDQVTANDLLRTRVELAVRVGASVSDVAVSDARGLSPFGLVASRSMLSYRGLVADSMLTARFQSNLYAGLRADGTYLLVEIRIYAGTDWGDAVEAWYPVLYRPVWEAFGQDSLPTADVR
jgi:hypothetical protein